MDTDHNPFGDPDGSKADIDLARDQFVEFDDRKRWGDLALSSYDRRARIIVGRKGSGKTIYLRRVHADATRDQSLFAAPVQSKPPPTHAVVAFAQLFSTPALARETWARVWRRAIAASLSTYLISDERLRRQALRFSPTLTDALEAILPHACERGSLPIYATCELVLSRARSIKVANSFLGDSRWAQLDETIASAMSDLPPLCFFLDCLDEHFENAPFAWLNCQTGLFQAVMELLQDPRIGGKLHVIVTLRDIICSAYLSSTEHASRFRTDDHIRHLVWDHDAALFFLQEKVRRLDDGWFVEPASRRASKSVAAWLGRTTLTNGRKSQEPIEVYLLRHTRLLPRDVIMMGNELCSKIARCKATGAVRTDAGCEELIRRTVASVAKGIAKEQITICATQLAADTMPRGLRGESIVPFYSDPDYVRHFIDAVVDYVSKLKRERMQWRQFQAAIKAADHAFESLGVSGERVLEALWSNGLLGYRRTKADGWTFFGTERVVDEQVPRRAYEYGFHSVVMDYIPLEPVGVTPISSFSEEEQHPAR
jgi:hypothetical protein